MTDKEQNYKQQTIATRGGYQRTHENEQSEALF